MKNVIVLALWMHLAMVLFSQKPYDSTGFDSGKLVMSLCDKELAPLNYVVVRKDHRWSGTDKNCRELRRAVESRYNICQNTNIPEGYVIIAKNIVCSSCPGNKCWTIKKVREEKLLICKDQKIPEGYIVSRKNVLCGSCPGKTGMEISRTY